MAEANMFNFSFKELAGLMIKKQKIHEGYWGLYVKFGIVATNAGPNDEELKPAAIVPILEIGLQKYEQLNSLSVDASVVNPKSTEGKPIKPGKSAKGS